MSGPNPANEEESKENYNVLGDIQDHSRGISYTPAKKLTLSLQGIIDLP